jgi:AcrR family transcriptional regulator
MSIVEPLARAGGRQRDPQTDAALIEAVLDLVGAGATLSGLSLSAIAEHAGVSRNSLYRRWKTKEALYLDVLASVNKPLPELAGRSARQDVAEMLALLVERTLDRRCSGPSTRRSTPSLSCTDATSVRWSRRAGRP